MKTLKHYIYTLLCAGVIGAGATACTDYLDKAPESEISEDEAFKNFKNFQGFVEELYYCVPNFTTYYWNNNFNWGEDEITNVGPTYFIGNNIDLGNFWIWQQEHDGWRVSWLDNRSFSTDLNSGDDGPADGRVALWPASWYGIRKCNLGLANLGRLTECTKEQRDIIEGQLLFFRGWFHFELMQFFGGLPYIDEVLGSGKLTLPRLSYHECADRAAEDFSRAAKLLPINWDDTATGIPTRGNNDLRINKIMALGYLGKDLLWAGSPLMNKVSTGSESYNSEYCSRAAEAFGELLALVEEGKTQYSLVNFKDYKDLFLTHERNGLMPGSTEAIFRCPVYNYHRSCLNQYKCYQTALINASEVTMLPTANYVNYYGMANGMPLDDPDAHFDKSHPWKDRDPRFYHDIRFDGCKLELGMVDKANSLRYAPLYTDGKLRDGLNGSRTGYLNYKFIRDDYNQWDMKGGWSATHMLISYMRLADVYLMYAEAAANATGMPAGKSANCSLSAVDAVNTVRARAGVDPVNSKYTGSLDGFMSELRRERAVELAFEGHRFNDLRRWRLLDKYPYNIKTSQEFTRVGDLTGIESDSSKGIDTKDPSQSEVIGFREEVILTRNFDEKHYWLPLKVNDTKMYVEFGQNPGW